MYLRALSAMAILMLAVGTCLGDRFLDDGDFHTIEDTVTGSLYVDYDVPPSIGTSVEIIGGGEVMDTIYTYGTSEVTIHGGSVWGGQYIEAIVAADSSQITVNSGTVGDTIVGLNDSYFTFSGGDLQGNFVIAAGEVGMWDTSTFLFSGVGFTIDGDPAPYGVYDTGGTGHREGSISGTLDDGSSFASSYTMYDGGSIVIVPEPLTAGLVAVGGLALIPLRRRRIA